MLQRTTESERQAATMGHLVERYYRSRGLSSTQFAKNLGIPVEVVQQVVHGEVSGMSRADLNNLVDELDLPQEAKDVLKTLVVGSTPQGFTRRVRGD